MSDDSGRFWDFVKKSDECWIWQRSSTTLGYGQLWIDGRKVFAHRFAYELTYGRIPEGLELDHLCRNPSCVRPSHLDPVSHRENVLRGTGPSAIAARKTHCNHGHEFTETNTYRTPKNGKRRCRQCDRRRSRELKARRRTGETCNRTTSAA